MEDTTNKYKRALRITLEFLTDADLYGETQDQKQHDELVQCLRDWEEWITSDTPEDEGIVALREIVYLCSDFPFDKILAKIRDIAATAHNKMRFEHDTTED